MGKKCLAICPILVLFGREFGGKVLDVALLPLLELSVGLQPFSRSQLHQRMHSFQRFDLCRRRGMSSPLTSARRLQTGRPYCTSMHHLHYLPLLLCHYAHRALPGFRDHFHFRLASEPRPLRCPVGQRSSSATASRLPMAKSDGCVRMRIGKSAKSLGSL